MAAEPNCNKIQKVPCSRLDRLTTQTGRERGAVYNMDGSLCAMLDPKSGSGDVKDCAMRIPTLPVEIWHILSYRNKKSNGRCLVSLANIWNRQYSVRGQDPQKWC